MTDAPTRYAVLRCPSPGPPALIAPPNDFATLAEAEARIAAVEARARMAHHTHLEVLHYRGSLHEALVARGALR